MKEMILFYNKTKGGIDVFDKLCHAHTTARVRNGWPMRFFFGILDQAQVNARILYTCKYAEANDSNMKLSISAPMKQLVLSLVTPYLWDKLKNVTLRSEIRKGIKVILDDKSAEPEEERPKLNKRTRYALCPSKKDKKMKI